MRNSRFLVFFCLVLHGVAVASLRADEESPALAPYQGPLDESLDRALEYLAKNQRPNGTFPSGFGDNTAITSLGVMAFLAKGYSPGLEPYGDVINKGVDFVLQCQKPNGLLIGPGSSHGPMYCHAISTLLLSEVSGMVEPARQKRIDEALGKALGLILAAQKVKKPPGHQGGWRYQHNSGDSDISCSGWSLMALRSARNAGAAVPKEAIDEAVKYIQNCRHPDGGFGYQPGSGPGSARTGTGLLCLELSGLHRDKVTLAAGDWILKNGLERDAGGFFYYTLYYCAQGMFQLGDEQWEKFAARIYDRMLKSQQQDGSWPKGQGHEAQAGQCYSTSMAVLALTVSYRQLPIYQR